MVGNGFKLSRELSRADTSPGLQDHLHEMLKRPSSGPLRVGQNLSALLIIPEPELDDNQDITLVQLEPTLNG